MATIRDVAKLAGVSHGTVSNILNGVNGVSIDKMLRVERAMKELGYKPNAFARNLKTSKTMQFDVILPNINDLTLARLYTNLTILANSNKYSIALYITNEVEEQETLYLNRSLMHNSDGVILMTCQPNKTDLFQSLINDGLKIVFIQRQVESIDHNFVGIDVRHLLEESILNIYKEGIERVAMITGPGEYSFEKDCINGFIGAHRELNQEIVDDYCQVTNYNLKSAMKAAVKLMRLPEKPEVIIATNRYMAEGVTKAIDLMTMPDEKRPGIVVLGDDSWSNIKEEGVKNIPLPYAQVGEKAFELLMGMVKMPAFADMKTIHVRTQIDDKKPDYPIVNLQEKLVDDGRPIRVLMLKGESAYATSSLLTDFKKRTGIEVQIDTFDYIGLYEKIKSSKNTDEYDVFMIDIPWLEELTQNDYIEQLDHLYDKNKDFLNNIDPQVFEFYSRANAHLYAVPYMYCAQLLYYRKDLFENAKNRRLFYEQYKTDLRPPKTWNEFNAVAKFFTRKYNSESETLYGTTLGSRISSSAICEFLPRLWHYGGTIYDANEKVAIDSRQAIKALENYKESFQFASETSCDHGWDEQVKEFSEGKAAMMIMYNVQASNIADRSKSSVVGKIGCEIIPGKYSVLGGWSLGVNKHSKHKNRAMSFIFWACSKEIAITGTILGGSSPCKIAFEDMELISIYPWQSKALEAFKFTKRRNRYEHEFEEILSEAVYKTVTNQIEPETALSNVAKVLKK